MDSEKPASDCEKDGILWKSLTDPHPVGLALLILLGIILEFSVHYHLGIETVYTHFFYLIIVLAALWYGVRALWVAVFFGVIHVGITYLLTSAIPPDVLVRAGMFCIVAFVVGTVAEHLHCYHDLLVRQNRELTLLNAELQEANAKLETSRTAYETANRKLNLLSSITRHDIHNQLTAILGYIGLASMRVRDPEIQSLLEKEELAAENIVRQIEFTKNYENLGVHAPLWQDVTAIIGNIKSVTSLGAVTIETRLDGLEVYADPLFEKVCINLIDNSLRHGERVRKITFSTIPYANNAIAVVYEDDGVGVHEEDKVRIFEKGFGKHTGLGLFLVREILAITGITIKERGEYTKGVRFEILVPEGKYRFSLPEGR